MPIGTLRRWFRRILFSVVGLLGFALLISYYVANRYYNNAALGKRISQGWSKSHRGRMTIGKVHWKGSAVLALLRNGYDEVRVTDVRIYDSRGELALHVPEAVGEIKLWDIILHGDFRLKYLKFTQATVRFERYLRPDGPLPNGERYEVGLIGAFEPTRRARKKARRRPSGPAKRQSRMVVERFELSGIKIIGELDDVGFRLLDASLHGSLDYGSASVSKPAHLRYDVRPAMRTGEVRVGKKSIPISSVIVRRLAATRRHPDRVIVDAEADVDDAKLLVRGGLTGIGSEQGARVALKGQAKNFGGLLARLSERAVSDEGSELKIELAGPVENPFADIEVRGLGLRHERIHAKGLRLKAHFEGGVLDVHQTRVAVAGGHVRARAQLQVYSKAWKATVIADKLQVDRFVKAVRKPKPIGPLARSGVSPGKKKAALTGLLSGWVDASGSLDDPSAGWTRYDLTLDRLVDPKDKTDPLPPQIRSHGILHASPERFDIRELRVESAVANIDVGGRFWPRKLEMDLALKARAQRLRQFLYRLKQPPLVAALTLAGRVQGSVYNPRVRARTSVYGIRQSGIEIRKAVGGLSLADGNLDLYGVRGSIYGGSLAAKGRLMIYERDIRRMRPRMFVRASGSLTGVDLAHPTRGGVEALLSGRFAVRGTPDALRGRASARSRLLRMAGQWYRDLRVEVGLTPRRVIFKRAEIWRERRDWLQGRVSEDGGRLTQGHIWVKPGGSLIDGRRIDVRVNVADLPLGAIPGLDGRRPPVSGKIDGSVHIGGRIAAPVLEGAISLVDTRLRGVWAAGDREGSRGELKLTPQGQVTELQGNFFRQMINNLQGQLDLGRKKGVSIGLNFKNLPIHRFLPELAKRGDITGMVTGRIEIGVGGADEQGPGGLKRARVIIPHQGLVLRVRRYDVFTQRSELAELRNDRELRLRFDGERLHVERMVLTDAYCRLAVDSTAGEERCVASSRIADRHRLDIRGVISAKNTQLRVRGGVSLVALGMLLPDRLDELRGTVGIDVSVAGPIAKPRVDGRIYPAGIRARPKALRGDVYVRAGEIRISNDVLQFRAVRVQLGHEEVDVWGLVGLDNWKPGTLDLMLDGRVGPRALEILVGESVGRVRGTASDVDLSIGGTADTPLVNGTVRLGALSIGLRGLGKEIAVKPGGIVKFNESLVELRHVRGTLDDGPFQLSGTINLKGSGTVPEGGNIACKLPFDRIDLRFTGTNIPYRSGGEYEVELNPNLRLLGDAQSCLTLSGVVDVVGGKYFQKFSVSPTKALTPSRTYESSEPFYEGTPWLANLKLNITVSTARAFRVKNNLADLGVDGTISVTGTLSNRRLGGTVDLREGTFRIPFLRGRYTVTGGVVDFDRGRPVGKDEPWVRIVGTMTYTDRSDTAHEITLTVQGYVSSLRPTWSSDTGLSSSQTLALLVTGRTPDELRKGRSASLPNLAPLVEEYLPVDFWFDLGSDSIQVYVEKKLGRYFKLKGEVEMGYVGQQRQEGMVVFRISDRLSLVGKARRRIQGEDVTSDTNTLSGRIEAKYKIKLKGNLKRAFGF